MELKRKDLIYPELCYKIIGVLFDIYNDLGNGYQEKHYQRAIAKAFRVNNIKFQQEVHTPLNYKKTSIGCYFLDFLVEGQKKGKF